MTVQDLNRREDLQFVNDSQDTDYIRDHIAGACNFDSFFVRVENGHYAEVYGMDSIIPYLDNEIIKIV